MYLPNYLLTRNNRLRNNITWGTLMVWITQLYLVSDDLYENNIGLVSSLLPIHVDVI